MKSGSYLGRQLDLSKALWIIGHRFVRWAKATVSLGVLIDESDPAL